MDRYERRALEREAQVQEAFELSGKPAGYWEKPEIVEYQAVTQALRNASKTYKPPEGV